MSRLGLFGYGSLVLHESASMTLGRPAGELRPARLHDWSGASPSAATT